MKCYKSTLSIAVLNKNYYWLKENYFNLEDFFLTSVDVSPEPPAAIVCLQKLYFSCDIVDWGARE